MERAFIYTEPFRRCWKAMGLSDDDLVLLETMFLNNPGIGDPIPGTGGACKMRIPLEGRGTSGGGRVIYVDIFKKERVYLLFAYPKNVQEDLTPEQSKMVRQMVEAIKKER